MPGYTDVFGNPITRDDVRLAIQVIADNKHINPMRLHRPTRWGLGKASNVLKLLFEAGVIGEVTTNGRRAVILRNEAAINAALRQLKKGKR